LSFVFKYQHKLEGLQIYLDLGFGYPHRQFDPESAKAETSIRCGFTSRLGIRRPANDWQLE